MYVCVYISSFDFIALIIRVRYFFQIKQNTNRYTKDEIPVIKGHHDFRFDCLFVPHHGSEMFKKV